MSICDWSSGVCSSDLIEERGATSLKDALRNVTGISLMAGEGGGAQGDNFRIRGFAANNDMFINGVRDIAPYGRDPFNLEQIEVVDRKSVVSGERRSVSVDVGGGRSMTKKKKKK